MDGDEAQNTTSKIRQRSRGGSLKGGSNDIINQIEQNMQAFGTDSDTLHVKFKRHLYPIIGYKESFFGIEPKYDNNIDDETLSTFNEKFLECLCLDGTTQNVQLIFNTCCNNRFSKCCVFKCMLC